MKSEKISTTRIYGHDELHIPMKIKKNYTEDLNIGTLIDWYITDEGILLKPRKKVTITDVNAHHTIN